MELRCGSAIRGVRLIWGVKFTQASHPATLRNTSAPPDAATRLGNALQGTRTAHVRLPVVSVLVSCRLAQVFRSVVVADAVYVINEAHWPSAPMNSERNAMAKRLCPAKTDTHPEIAIRLSEIARLPTRTLCVPCLGSMRALEMRTRPFPPRQNPAFRVVIEALAEVIDIHCHAAQALLGFCRLGILRSGLNCECTIAMRPAASAPWLDQSCSGPSPILRLSSRFS